MGSENKFLISYFTLITWNVLGEIKAIEVLEWVKGVFLSTSRFVQR